jgi:hypothetical protein
MNNNSLSRFLLGAALAAASLLVSAQAQGPYPPPAPPPPGAYPPPPPPPGAPGAHPAYLHALSNLRAAMWLIRHRPGEGVANGDEHLAEREVGAAIREIRKAAFDDGKDANYTPPPDPADGRFGRLHRAIELLRDVRGEIAREEDNAFAQGLRNRALGHVDGAIRATQAAIAALHSIGQ